jgi:hypothetical protein
MKLIKLKQIRPCGIRIRFTHFRISVRVELGFVSPTLEYPSVWRMSVRAENLIYSTLYCISNNLRLVAVYGYTVRVNGKEGVRGGQECNGIQW